MIEKKIDGLVYNDYFNYIIYLNSVILALSLLYQKKTISKIKTLAYTLIGFKTILLPIYILGYSDIVDVLGYMSPLIYVILILIYLEEIKSQKSDDEIIDNY